MNRSLRHGKTRPEALEVPALAASKKFSRYKDVTERKVRGSVLKPDEVLEKLKTIFLRYASAKPHQEMILLEKILKEEKPGYDARDLERFSLAIREFSFNESHIAKERIGQLMGSFINMLMMERAYPEYTIHTEGLDYRLDFLGFGNKVNLMVKGPAGGNLGSHMQRGRIIVDGDAGNNVGHRLDNGEILIIGNADQCVGAMMNGGSIVVNGFAVGRVGTRMQGGKILLKSNTFHLLGEDMQGGIIIVEGDGGQQVGYGMEGGAIIVEGDCGEQAGWAMQGGAIAVKGNAGSDVGDGMTGGEIHLNGHFERLGDIKGGKIYHKGKLIIDK